MLSFTHTITSAAIGAHVQSAPFAFSIAFLSHLFADTLLHWNVYTDRHRWPYVWTAIDVGGGLLAAYWLLPDRVFTTPVLAAILGGNLPDIWSGLWDLGHKLRGTDPNARKDLFLRFHDALQNEILNPARGLVWQGPLAIFAVLAIRS